MSRLHKEAKNAETRTKERNYEPSPVRSSRRSRRFDSSPGRAYRARTYDPSPSRTQKNSREDPIYSNFTSSPLRVSFRYGNGPERAGRESKSAGRFDASPSREMKRSSALYQVCDAPDARRARSRKLDASPLRDPAVRSRTHDSSPLNGGFSASESVFRFRQSSPSPIRSRDRQYKLDTHLGDSHMSRRSFDYAIGSPRLRVRSPSHRQPLLELPTPGTSSQSYRIAPTSRDDDSDLDYLTKVREILLGDPIKGKTEKPAEVLPHMYIGNQSNAESLRLLRKLGVTHVLNCAGFKGPRKNPDANPYEGLGIEYLEFKADDRDAYDISQHFDAAFSYLDRVKRSGGICLVHCALGINRSGATVVAYLMIHSKWPLLKALQCVKKKRGVVLSNHGFQRQLIRFARQQSLLEALPPKAYMHKQSPQEEHRFVKSLNQAKYGHWTEALDEMKRSTPAEHRHSTDLALGSGPQSAIMYRYARFMNRDKV